MSNKEQTAVEWLTEQLIKLIPPGNELSIGVMFDKAKEMEKQQIMDAFVECWKSNVPDGVECKLSAEEYYNETFKPE